MLFTTVGFCALFLPLTLLGYFTLGRRRPEWASAWLFAASTFFYGWWMPTMTLLLLASIAANFVIGRCVVDARRTHRRAGPWSQSGALMTLGIAANLAALCYFKYANFFIDNANALLQTQWHVERIVLPIGISFYTFTQIAYLVDSWAGKVNETRPVHYGLFVTYFPHLVAGPVLHHAQMMPQFQDHAVYRFQSTNFFAGLAIFAAGLLKKVVLADGVAPYADAVFAGADGGVLPSATEAWLGALAYTFQLYFDFSGYSDMAIGLSWMFNIRLPFNFNSPYKATSIVDFWRRWHISLSNFLRDYLYIPLGGNRNGAAGRYLNLTITMVLGGLWHGASWSFALWGTLHGVYLMVNHGFRALTARAGWQTMLDRSWAYTVLAWGMTFLAAVLAWVLFRAQSLPGAGRVLHALSGFAAERADGIDVLFWNSGLRPQTGALWCLVLGFIAVALPNTNVLGERLRAWLQQWPDLRPAAGAAALCTAVLLLLINSARDTTSAFIYFNF